MVVYEDVSGFVGQVLETVRHVGNVFENRRELFCGHCPYFPRIQGLRRPGHGLVDVL